MSKILFGLIDIAIVFGSITMAVWQFTEGNHTNGVLWVIAYNLAVIKNLMVNDVKKELGL